jgi:hypothetical protein
MRSTTSRSVSLTRGLEVGQVWWIRGMVWAWWSPRRTTSHLDARWLVLRATMAGYLMGTDTVPWPAVRAHQDHQQ